MLFIPGPVTVSETVLRAMAEPLIDHRGPEFARLHKEITSSLQPIFGTASDVLLLGSSGTGALEAAIANSFQAGDRLLAAPVGLFGERLAAIARTYGCEVDVIETAPGAIVEPLSLKKRLAEKEYAGLLLTHNETSTGVQHDMGALAAAIRGTNAISIVDSVSGMGASPFEMDRWGFDVVVSASQKVLAAPPGVAMIAASERAWKRFESVRSPRFYFDLRTARKFAAIGQTPWTPPVSILGALHAAIEQYESEGPATAAARLALYAAAVRAAAHAFRMEIFSQPGAHSNTVVALRVPQGVDADALLNALRERGIVFSGGQEGFKGLIVRIGTMGDLSQTDILGALGALEITLLEQGHQVPVGAGVQAALRVFLDAENARSDGAQRADSRAAAQTTAEHSELRNPVSR